MWPIWLLDIDGVINASPYKIPKHVWPEDQWVVTRAGSANGKSWKITAAKPVIDFIRKVHDGKWAEVVWLTTWQTDANNVSFVLGLPHFPVLENPMLDGTRYHGKDWWKLSEASKILATGRPVIWTDDDISREIRTLAERYQRQDGEAAPLLISPNSSEGLTPKHLHSIAAFLSVENDREFW